jgi:hypothetical protein
MELVMKLRALQLIFVAMGIFVLALAAEPAVATDGIEAGAIAWVTAGNLASMEWPCTTANTTVTCSTAWVCDWLAGITYTGMCYDFGGYETKDSFLNALDCGKGAGSHISLGACTTGTDCSGLVSLAWGLGGHYGTSLLLDTYGTPVPAGEPILAGYAYVKTGDPGHCYLLNDWNGVGYPEIVEAYGTPSNRVHKILVDRTYFNGYQLRRNVGWVYPDSPLEYCRVSGGTVSWATSDETGIDSYVVMEADNLKGPWVTVGSAVSAGATPYSISGVSSKYAMVCGDDGSKLCELGIAQPTAALKRASAPGRAVSNRRDSKTSCTTPLMDGRVGIIAPARWSATVAAMKNYWETQFGCDVVVSLLPDDWPYFQDLRMAASGRAEVKATIDSWWSSVGVRYVILVGDRVPTTDVAEGYCDQAIIPGYYGYTDVDECTNPEYCIQQLYATDMPYADVDGDGIPDMVLARLPVSTEGEFAGYFEKMVSYNLGEIGASQYTVMSVVADVAGPRMSDAGEYTCHIADTMRLGPFASASVTEIRESAVLEDGESSIQQKICDTWSTTWPELVVINSYKSNQVNVGEVLAAEQWPYITPEHNAVVLAPTCYGGLFERGRTPEKTPLEAGLVSQLDGPIAYIGPSAGTWEVANFQFERFFAEELLSEPARPMAESYLLAVRRMYLEFPDQPKMLRTIVRYHFLGDPLSPFRNRVNAPVSGVPSDGLSEPRLTCCLTPNPFNPRVTIAMENPRSQELEIKIHDVRGMLVKSVFSGKSESGHQTFVWDGDDNQGRAVSAGVYLVTARAGAERTVHKVSLVR